MHRLATNRYQRALQRVGLGRSHSQPPDTGSTSSDTARPADNQFRPDIEGLRAVAVLAVVLFHADMPGISGGFVGVDVFFVISGFLITGLLWREVNTTGRVKLSRFYGSRARRLLPASALVGVVIVIGSAIILPPLQARRDIGDGIASALYVGNYRFALRGIDYFIASAVSPSPFEHYWSLGVEEQFYLVWPAMIIGAAWLVRRGRRANGALVTSTASARPYVSVLVAVAIGSFALSLLATHVAAPVAFFSLPTRAWELAVGGLVALTVNQWRRLGALPAAFAGWAGLVLILFGCTQLEASTPYPGTAALLPVLSTALVIGAGCAAPDRGVGQVLALRPMRAVGRVSYSWYLWHWPVELLANPWGPTASLAGIFVSGGLAVVTLHLVENPIRFAASLRQSATRSLAVGGAVTAIAVGVALVALVLIPTPVGRGPAARPLVVTAASTPTGTSIGAFDAAVQQSFGQVQAAVAASADLTAVPANLSPQLNRAEKPFLARYGGCMRNLLEVDQPQCATGDTASPVTVALVGDSHAVMWNPAFEQVANQRHWRLETMGKAGCSMLDLPVFNQILRRDYTECYEWRNRVFARLRAERPKLVVLAMRRFYAIYDPTDRLWTDSLSRLVHQVHATGAQVLVLGPIPDPHLMVPNCLSGHLDDATACSPARSAAVNGPAITAESAATKTAGGSYADLTALFCTADRCPTIVGNTLVYADDSHVTVEYSRVLAPVIAALADRALALG